ncbi:MAG: hypothetical protein JWL83_3576 [Actinomycetia bacterium]|nr:hypothetical protein [Actinomycetes bacterium]
MGEGFVETNGVRLWYEDPGELARGRASATRCLSRSHRISRRGC